MKKSILMMLVALAGLTGYSQTEDEKVIEETIREFAKAGDKNDVEALDKLLNENYSVVMNRLFGSETVTTVSKKDYLAKIESKEWGGDKREVVINKIIVNGNTAAVHATLIGSKMTFISIYTLIKDSQGNWTLLGDLPTIK